LPEKESMRRKHNYYPLALALVMGAALLMGCGQRPEAAAQETPEAVVVTPGPTPAPTPVRQSLSLVELSGHEALMETDDGGNFYPLQGVSKVQFCQSIYDLVEGLEQGRVAFLDYRSWSAGYQAVASLYTEGLLPETSGENFYPAQSITRAEAGEILTRLSQRLTGQEAQRAAQLAEDVTQGVTSASGQAKAGTDIIFRQELAVILERLMGREPDEVEQASLFLRQMLPEDVTRDNYAWAYITDAVTAEQVEPLEGGVHRAYGTLYATWDDGTLVIDEDYGVWTFGLDGAYTTGDSELDEYLRQALEACGANDLDDWAALKAAYLYVKYNFEYLVRPEDMDTIEVGVFGWEYDRAVRFFRYGGGTCYGFAAGFGLMARMLGYNAYAVAAQINEYYAPHGFVVIPENGVDWIYDVEMEATRPERHGDLDLFHIRDYAVYNYWYIPDW
jgi:hypothetical protein